MSLSEQIQRVDGSQNSTLKTILTKLGVSVGSQKIDQYPTLANSISAKLNPNNLVSASTASAYGLSSTATTDQVLAKARSLITTAQNTANSANTNANGRLKIFHGSYTGTGNASKTINVSGTPQMLFLQAKYNETSIYSAVSAYMKDAEGAAAFNTSSYGKMDEAAVGNIAGSGGAIKVSFSSNSVVIENAAGRLDLFNGTRYTYYYTVLCT